MNLPARDPAPSPDQTRWFAQEVQAHHAQLRAYLRGAFPAVRDVDDVVQESYLRMWKAVSAHPIHRAKAFLFKIARNLAFNSLRESRVAPTEPWGDSTMVSILEERPSPSDELTYHEKVALLSDALSSLPARCREIVMLRKIDGLPQKEVAVLLGISEKTVENQLARGIGRCEIFLKRRGVQSFQGDEA